MKIPELLLNVTKRLCPEIDEIIFNRFEKVVLTYNPMFEAQAGFVVYVNILIDKGKNPTCTIEEYADKINTTFKYTYTEIDYVTFIVERFEFHKEMTRDEVFQMLFHIDNIPQLK